MSNNNIAKSHSRIVSLIYRFSEAVANIQNIWFIVILIVLAASTGTIGILLNNPLHITSDGITYYNYAVNIKNTGTYSSAIEPTEENFFREPGYPYYLASMLSVYHMKNKALYLEKKDSLTNEIKEYRSDIVFIRYSQLFLMICSIVVFYAFLINITSKVLARVTSFLCAAYYPFIVHSIYILREPLLVLIFTLYAYLLTLYLKDNRTIFLILSAILAGLMTLTFQVMVVFIPISVFLLLISPNNKRIIMKAKESIIFCIFAVMIISPWIYKVYRYYPDIRVAKTMGSALTYESWDYAISVGAASRRGVIDRDELSKIKNDNWYLLSSKEIFDRSFNGWYKEQTAIWNSKNHNTSPSIALKLKGKLKKYWNNYYRNWIRHSWPPLNFKERDGYSVFMLIPFLISAFIGVISTAGLFVCTIRERFFYILPYLFFILGAIVFFGSEKRRSIPFMPMILFLFVYMIVFICRYIIGIQKRKIGEHI